MSTAQAQELRKEIYKTLSRIEVHGHDFPRIYGDWLELMTAALVGDDKTYLEVMRTYEKDNQRPKGQRPGDYFAEAYAHLSAAWEADNSDHLGALYEEHVSHGHLGQFFTPEAMCDLMAEITCPELEPGKTVCDPACGSGRNLLAIAKKQPKARFYGMDLDRRCVLMTALNMVHRNLDAVVVLGDSIRLEQHGAYICTSTPYGGDIRFVDEHHEIPVAVMGGLPKREAPEIVPVPQREFAIAKAQRHEEEEQYSLSF